MLVVLLERLDFIFPMTTITRVFPMIPKKNIHPNITGTITTSGPKVSVVWFVSICSSVQMTVSFRFNPMFSRIQEARSKQINISPLRSTVQSLSGLFAHFLKLARADKSLARWSSTPFTLGNAPAGYEARARAHILHWRMFFPGKTLEQLAHAQCGKFPPGSALTILRDLVMIGLVL